MVNSASVRSLRQASQKREEHRVNNENIKMFERLLLTYRFFATRRRPQVPVLRAETDYQQSVAYQKLIAKSNRVWDRLYICLLILGTGKPTAALDPSASLLSPPPPASKTHPSRTQTRGSRMGQPRTEVGNEGINIKT